MRGKKAVVSSFIIFTAKQKNGAPSPTAHIQHKEHIMAKKLNGLGRGLDAIFLDNQPSDDGRGSHAVMPIKLSLIDPRASQPRKTFDAEALEALAASIQANGVFQPILVRESAGGRYQIIAGERRFRAAKIAQLTEIPAILLEKDDKQTAQIALVENIQREDLNAVEEAAAYASLAQEYGMTQEALAQQVGKSRSAVANALRLLDLPDDVLGMVAAGRLSAGHARTLLGLHDRDAMVALAKRAEAEEFSVRRLEDEVKRANRPKKAEEEAPAPMVDYVGELEQRVQSHLGRKVKIEQGARKKTLTLYYEDNEDLDELLCALCGKNFFET